MFTGETLQWRTRAYMLSQAFTDEEAPGRLCSLCISHRGFSWDECVGVVVSCKL
jgi:hypothetical protein